MEHMISTDWIMPVFFFGLVIGAAAGAVAIVSAAIIVSIYAKRTEP